MRRQLEKFPDLEEKIKTIIKRYKEVSESKGVGFGGLLPEEGEEVVLLEAGPIGFLLKNRER